mmetsp:Transcript_26062/g.77324  ORF Transcript_26062/g.77324 Transcript_26062/m.77324 type:complete len:202 (-) Transcript_26062:1109-1714(-)
MAAAGRRRPAGAAGSPCMRRRSRRRRPVAPSYQSTGATAAQPLAPRHHSSNGNLGILPAGTCASATPGPAGRLRRRRAACGTNAPRFPDLPAILRRRLLHRLRRRRHRRGPQTHTPAAPRSAPRGRSKTRPRCCRCRCCRRGHRQRQRRWATRCGAHQCPMPRRRPTFACRCPTGPCARACRPPATRPQGQAGNRYPLPQL